MPVAESRKLKTPVRVYYIQCKLCLVAIALLVCNIGEQFEVQQLFGEFKMPLNFEYLIVFDSFLHSLQRFCMIYELYIYAYSSYTAINIVYLTLFL